MEELNIQERLATCLDEISRLSKEFASVFIEYEDVIKACEISYVSGLISDLSPEEPFVMTFGSNPVAALQAILDKLKLEQDNEE